MKITTLDIIKMLSFEEAFKTKLLADWESLSIDKKNAIGEILWDTYADIYQDKLDTNTQLAMMDVAEGKESLDKELYAKIREKTEKELAEQFNQTVPASNLSETRAALEDILSNSAKN